MQLGDIIVITIKSAVGIHKITSPLDPKNEFQFVNDQHKSIGSCKPQKQEQKIKCKKSFM